MAAKKKVEAAPAKKAGFPKATEKDFAVIANPIITEKSMAKMQNENKVTVRVAPTSNRTEVKLAFERIFQVKVDDVRIVNVHAKATTRGTRYQGSIQGYKKAIVTIHEGEAIDLFRE